MASAPSAQEEVLISENFPLDLCVLRSNACAAYIHRSGMMSGSELSITGCLKAISARLDDAAAIGRAAVVCAEGGSEREAVRISIDLDELLNEANTLHSALT